MGGSMGMGYGKSDTGSHSQSDSYGYNQATSQQNVWGAQQPGLQALYGQAQQLLGGQGLAQPGQAVAQQGVDAWGQAMQPGSNPFFDKSVQAAIDQASQGFTRNVLPELEARGVGAGQYGSSRDQLARGQAAGDFGQGLAQATAQQYSQQYAGDQSRQAQLIGMTPEMQATQYAPLGVAAQLLGGPTVLGQSQSSGEQFAKSIADSFGKSRNYEMKSGGGVKGG